MTDKTTSTSFGDVEITRVHEWTDHLFSRPDLLPDSARQEWEAEKDWLEPVFWSAESEDAWLTSQSFLVRSGGRTILVDTGIGNGKPRPGVPPFDHLDTGYLTNLAALGVRPQDVDLVVCTHLHPDHIGWNTTLEDGVWRPTFPHATHLLPKADFDLLSGLAKSGDAPDPLGYVTGFLDSIAPVVEHAETQLWDGEDHVIDEALRLVAVPGHSPGAAAVTISSGGDHALLAGDLVHHPMQILDPRQRNALDADAATAEQSRIRMLGWAAEHSAPVFGGHFPGGRGARISAAGGAFRIDSWTTV
ncbi:MBL fold metallo-hydrolase [Amycolatopsis sp. NPDC047767]|uniref:MBL fold metallo-hydrolase n=1 Tax=Amycolatopsis sp. NPDC047767 TaxID=3156765 RepID=UPI0034568136